MTEYIQTEAQAGNQTTTFLLRLTWLWQNVSQLDPDAVIDKISFLFHVMKYVSAFLLYNDISQLIENSLNIYKDK